MDATHSEFLITAYALAFIIMGALVAWIMLDHAALARALDDLEEDGTRRSGNRTKARR